MKSIDLFKSAKGQWSTSSDLVAALEAVGAADCQALYVHTGLSFGMPNPALRRVELLEALYRALLEIAVPTICVPTFTFSFCNGVEYDVQTSRSAMGALNEYVRLRPEAVRSVDPLMSVALIGQDRDLVENLGHESIGTDSTFDKLSRRRGVKFLFLGVRPGACFTYMHHLEWKARVPYRYNRGFEGRIIDAGRSQIDRYTLFVRYRGVTPNEGSFTYEELLAAQGHLRTAQFGDSRISCVSEPEASRVYLDLLRQDPNYFISSPFDPLAADDTFLVQNMVSL
jgi:aminoglycoside 3-N-acetyltransferase